MGARWIACVVAIAALPVAADPAERTVLTGKVVDPAGNLYPKARVLGTEDFYDPDNKSVAERFPASGYRVAADGTFEVREGQLRPGLKMLRYRTSASAEGYSTSDEVISVPKGKLGYAPAVVKLRPGVDHEIVVADDTTRAPLSGAILTSDCTTMQARTPVGADGKLALRGCDDRSAAPIYAEMPGYQIGGINTDFKLTSQTITLAKLHPLKLRVVDGASGAPVAACDVTANQVKKATDARGTVEMSSPFGTVNVAPSCAAYGANLDTGYTVSFSAADAATEHVVKLRHNFLVVGTAVDAKGKPAAGVLVEVRPINEISTARPMAIATATTDKAGAFRIDSFSADTFIIYAGGGDAKTIDWKTQKGPIRLVAK